MTSRFNPDDYIDVQSRITRFWEEYPDGAIRTRMESNPTDFQAVRYRAEVYKKREHPAPDATGYAFEIAGGRGANSTSHEENCETSAIGRALANMGYATSAADRPSRQEMQKVERMQATQSPTPINQPHGSQQAPQQRQQNGGYQGNGGGYGGQQQQGGGTGPGGYPMPSEAQKRMVYARSREAGLSDQDINFYCQQTFNQPYEQIGKRDISKLIDAIKDGQVPHTGGGGAHMAEEQAQAAYANGGNMNDLSDVPF